MEEFIVKNGKRLKCGYTTGSCAAAAVKAGAVMLLGRTTIDEVIVNTPKGIRLNLQIGDIYKQKECISCSVKKDAGDDPDVTDGIKIFAKVEKLEKEILIEGGSGIGRVTKSGLQCAVGEAAINPVPRQMIQEVLKEVSETYGYKGGFSVVISAEDGEEIAKKTFNPRLGITGGISILGTSGIVEPMSEKALIETIHREINVKITQNNEYFLVTPGNFGRDFALKRFGLDIDKGVKCSNYIGETIDYAVYNNIKNILLIGHAGKLCKIAGGIMNTHSRTADGRCEIFAAHAALCGASKECINNIMQSMTTDEINVILREEGLEDAVNISILEKIKFHLNYRANYKARIEVVMFTDLNRELQDRVYYHTSGAVDMIKELCKESDKG
ncbi:cobalt-precorrin-5B (C(1))-methyltransferase CbiD [Ruminiclostridium cellulolyticum]|uniref:Cobalt-precorrin-5B C(1)-methyltransferase n=1 Tax=Ruminiclostridium cellulolyticum (strain ATCC 35319 / DSM 5812 / JCM 6584 / H10) TaxID=394503 RepID=CBID_RUMCH|nr:cobalt-precorrin-5B (C(1))-methyltransferase CbiD [Ruminiclostridium cellulolyticum]B8I0Q1.1 RecName: Full=Cobalt-precorrin-5B C(1)-methyltransferase; AltName: Full=Cobalt-precorrin-6A synthase [Ruminiclostridium cellulolyticum H10]ACL75626.1 cobalamin biosynthesis protein CbiD [Ruminiclostridium cellulolyticum H10]